VTALVVLGLLLFTGGRSYTLHVEFLDAGRLVEGANVEIGGVTVGSVTGVGLTTNALADITISIDAGADIPLHAGTRAAIGEVGAATIANNFVAIQPGPTNERVLPDGATLPPTQTVGVVDIDALLDSLDPSVRANLRALISNSAQVFAGSGSRNFNDMLVQLDPALGQLDGLTQQVISDGADLGRLITTASEAAGVIQSRRGDLRSAVGHVAQALAAIASAQMPLEDILTRAPSVLQTGTRTLGDLATALTALRPTLRDIPPVAGPLGAVLGSLAPVARSTTPAIASLRAQLPAVRSALARFPALKPLAIAGLRSTGTALQSLNPLVRGLRLYSSDFVLGILNGLFAIPSGNYDKAGHYVHAEFAQSPTLLPGGILGAALPDLSGLSKLSPALFSLRTHLWARCPGGANPPAADGSSPWIADPALCNPADDIASNVDSPFTP
jgi:phospholipid/cholesterol/gamma-HCH transport system substrate-binding protein